jgi:hypothetical protein
VSPRPQQRAAGTRVLRNRSRRRVTTVRVGRVSVVERLWRRRPVDRLVRLLSVVVLTRCDDGGAVPTATSALEVVDGEVRELIRRRGLDPFTDPGPVRLLVRDVVADFLPIGLLVG